MSCPPEPPGVHPPPDSGSAAAVEPGMAPATPDIGGRRTPACPSQAATGGGSSCCAQSAAAAAAAAPAASISLAKVECDGVCSVPSFPREQFRSAPGEEGEVACAAPPQASDALPQGSGLSHDKVDDLIAQQEGSASNAASDSAATPISTPEKVESTPRRPKKRSTKGVIRFKVMKDKKVTPNATSKAEAQKKRKEKEGVSEPVGASSHKPVRRKLNFGSSENIVASFSRAKLMDDLKWLAKTRDFRDDPSVGIKTKKGKKRKVMVVKYKQSGEFAIVPYQRPPTDVSSSALVLGRDTQLSALVRDTQLAIVPHEGHKGGLHPWVLHLDDKTLQVYDVLRKWDETGNESFEGFDIGSGTEWENTRKGFELRVDMFIAIIDDLFGPKKNHDWGGSVIDSVVGTFLTQNVSDNLSSNAFMNLAARFPPPKRCHDDKIYPILPQLINVGKEHLNLYEASDTHSVNSVFTKHDPENDGHYEDIKGHYGQEYNTTVENFIAHVKQNNISTWDIDRLMDLVKDKSGKPVLGKTSVKKFVDSMKEKDTSHWDKLREEAFNNGYIKKNGTASSDSVDWEAVQHAPISDVASCIAVRGQHNLIACRIQAFLDRVKRDHGSFDLDWLQHVPRESAKNYLLSVHGLGDKSVDCIRLLSLKHKAFPVDVNVARIVTRLGWVELQPLPFSAEFHSVNLYPIMRDVQKYLWPRLCTISKEKLYKLHCGMITLGKVICTKANPNCSACPFRPKCKYFNSPFMRASLPPTEHGHEGGEIQTINYGISSLLNSNCTSSFQQICESQTGMNTTAERKPIHNCEPIIEMPPSPEREYEYEGAEQELFQDDVCDIEDIVPGVSYDVEIDLCSDKHLVHSDSWKSGYPKDMVSINPQTAFCQNRKLKNICRLRTERTAYVLQDNHPILQDFEERVPGEPSPYLLAVISFPDDFTMKGTILIPCRTANRGNFPLDGTYFQDNEVFADHSSSRFPVTIPRDSICCRSACTVYFGASVHSIAKGQAQQEIQDCYKKGYICVRGFDRRKGPKKLCAALHATNEMQGSAQNSRKKAKTSQQENDDEKAP